MKPAVPPRRPPPLPPRKPSHLQQSYPAFVHGTRQAKYNCSCGNNEKANICSCPSCHAILRGEDSPCPWYGYCLEPLAWTIEHEPVRTQHTSPLFTKLPKELREIIFDYALTGDEPTSFSILTARKSPGFNIKLFNQTPLSTIATPLLSTCRAIYLETWTLPLTLNPYTVTDIVYGSCAPALLPWQFALISSLDLTLQQTYLESPQFHHYMNADGGWQPALRRSGAYVAPLWYRADAGQQTFERNASYRYKCTLIPTTTGDAEPRHFLSHLLGKDDAWESETPRPPYLPWQSAMRVMKARPLTRLTLRIQHSDWWTWTDDPASSDVMQHLGLDPSVGNGQPLPLTRPTKPRMRALAEARRAGNHPEVDRIVGWAGVISSMADLRELELVLETYSAKKKQLEDVVEAAKTWVFPLEGTRWELGWDGEVGVSSWSFGGFGGKKEGGAWHTRETEWDVRSVRYVRRRVT